MKKIINQKRYDTNTAKKCAEWENTPYVTDFHHISETLYQKQTGEFFLHGEGGPASKYAESAGLNSWTGGERIMPMSYTEAQKWAEEHLNGEDYEKIFGDVEEDDSKVTVTLSLPKTVVEKLKRMASQTGQTQSEIIANLIK